MSLDTSHWTWLNHFFIWGSIIFYFIYTFIIYSAVLFNMSPFFFPNVNAAVNTFGSGAFWSSFFITAIICLLPVIGFRWTNQKLWPTLSDQIRKGVWKQKRVKNSSLVCSYIFNLNP